MADDSEEYKKTIIKTPLMTVHKGLQRIGDRNVISLSLESNVRMQNEREVKNFRKVHYNTDKQIESLISEKKSKWRMQNSVIKPTLNRYSNEYPEYFHLEVSESTDIFTENGRSDLGAIQQGCHVIGVIELSHVSIYPSFYQIVWIAHQLMVINPISPTKRILGSVNLLSYYGTTPKIEEKKSEEKKVVRIASTPVPNSPSLPPPPPPPPSSSTDRPLKFAPSVADLDVALKSLNRVVTKEATNCMVGNVIDSEH